MIIFIVLLVRAYRADSGHSIVNTYEYYSQSLLYLHVYLTCTRKYLYAIEQHIDCRKHLF